MAKRKKEKPAAPIEGIMNFPAKVVDIDLMAGSGLSGSRDGQTTPPLRSAAGARSSERRRILFWIIGTVVVAIGAALWIYGAGSSRPAARAFQDHSPLAAAAPVAGQEANLGVEVLETWTLPSELAEISGNVFIDSVRIACIQDNDGIIFIYNLRSRKIERRIAFGPGGDYEGIARIGNVFYVLRSDGRIFEVTPSGAGKPVVKEFKTKLSADQDSESLFYDEPNKRLLVGVKEKDLSGPDKGVYSFDLTSKTLSEKPVFSIPGSHEQAGAGKKSGGKKSKSQKIKPSELVVNSRNGDVYVLNGPHSEFIIADAAGRLRHVIALDGKIFPQPEGMSFSPAGELYISSEAGKKGASGRISRVRLTGEPGDAG